MTILGCLTFTAKAYAADKTEDSDSTVFESLCENAEGWITYNNTPLPQSIDYAWSWDNTHKYYKAAASVNGIVYPVDVTTISPRIDLSDYSNPTLYFGHTGKYFEDIDCAKSQCHLYVRESGSEWTEMEIDNWFTNNDWQFVGNAVDLKPFANKVIELGFRYSTLEHDNGVWEIRNIKLVADKDKEQGGTVLLKSFFDNCDGWTEEDILKPEIIDNIWEWDELHHYYKASSFVDGVNYKSESMVVSPIIDCTNSNNVRLHFAHAGKFFSSIEASQQECKLLIREQDSAWADVAIPVWFNNENWTFYNNTINLDEYSGKKIQIGLHYTSNEKAGAWEIKNMIVSDSNTDNISPVISNSESTSNKERQVFDLSGRPVSSTSVQPGIYIVKKGVKTTKIRVK